MEQLDIAIIGAGWHGLAMSKTYLEVCPNANLAVFDSAASIGGTWAKERLYPGLKTNNLLGTYEFSDFPMTPGRFDVKEGHHIPGHAVHDYLTQFAEFFYITPRIRLRQKVETAERMEDGSWSLKIISTESTKKAEPRVVVAKKLVVATGLTSEPFMPKFSREENFNRPLFHAKDLRDRANDVEKASKVVVLGGNKSAWDTCFFAAKTGAHVHMVMRPSGGGPSWVWPVLFSPFKISIQRLAATRFFTWFDPCIWSESTGMSGWVRHALHATWLGRGVVSGFWSTLERFTQGAHRYDDHPETQRLKPWVNPFWMGNSLSIHNYTSPWLDLVREGKIKVHIADVSSFSDGTVHLSNGETLAADAFVSCTGWTTEPAVRFLPSDLKQKLSLQRSDSIEQQKMTENARTEIFGCFPALQRSPNRILPPGTMIPPATAASKPSNTSLGYQLYRFLVPPEETFLKQRNIAFIGSHLALNATMIAQLQALWITAFFVNELPHLAAGTFDHKKVRYEAVLHNEHSAIRHPHEAGGAGARCPDLAFDCLSYMDLLSNDLGLPAYRKINQTGVWSEIFHRYGPIDFKGMVQEWLGSRRKVTNINGARQS